MIFVDAHSPGYFGVRFKPVKENLNRIRQITGARFDGDKTWICPLAMIDQFEGLFKGEFIYITPRHKMTGEAPPPPPKMYSKIPNKPITGIKPPHQLYNYQKFGANFLACIAGGTGHAMLTDKVGTGKTIQSIAGAHILMDEGKVQNVLVFCKASLKYQWLRDGIEKFTNDSGVVVDGTPKQRTQQYLDALSPNIRYTIVNYELLLHDLDKLKMLVQQKGIQLIIADEAHKITNHKGKMNNALQELVQLDKKSGYNGIPYIFYLTATPMSSKIEQLFGIFQIRRPDFFGKYTSFSKEYLKWSYNGRSQELVGYKNLDVIRHKTFPYMLRRTDAEIDMELPKMVNLFYRMDMTPLQKQLDTIALNDLDKAEARLKAAYKQNLPREDLEKIEGMAQMYMYVRKAIACHPILLTMSKSDAIKKNYGDIVNAAKDVRSPKLEELKELIQEMVVEGGEKLVIFSEYETMVGIIESTIKNMGIDCVTYTGRHSSKEKDDRKLEFEHNPDCKIMICTDAAAEGLNLQFAKYMVNYDLPWNPDKYDQRLGRIQRGGSKHKSVKNINLIMKESIDNGIMEALRNKKNMFKFFVENTEEYSQAIKSAMEESQR